jgi:hypothetical protein
MPYYNFEGNTKNCQIQVWHSVTTIRTALQKLDKLSFLDYRDNIRTVLNSISTNNVQYPPFHGIAGSSLRFHENLICYNMSNVTYLEIFSRLYCALDVDVHRCLKTDTTTTICNNSYDLALESYAANLLQLKKAFYAGVGAYNRESFEALLDLTWKY